MKKRTLTILFVLMLAAALLGCAASTPAPAAPAPSLSPNEAYALEKLNEINDMVLTREVVPEDYFRYLDETLTSLVREYNSLTTSLRINYTPQAISIAKTLFYEHQEDPGDYAHSELYFEWVSRITRYALYEDVVTLCINDPYLSYPLGKEAGGSFGLWAGRLHDNAYPELQEQTQEYFSLVDQLLTQFDEVRAVFPGTNR